jgi:hypothetical protein
MSNYLKNINLNGTEYSIASNIHQEPTLFTQGRELNEFTWSDLKQKCLDNDFSGLQIGDYKTIILDGGDDVLYAMKTIKMQIAGIDTYYGMRYGWVGGDPFWKIGHHIDWISKDVLYAGTEDSHWTLTDFSSISAYTQYSPFKKSNIYSYLNNTFFNYLSEELQSCITTKINPMTTGYPAGMLDSGEIGKLWLPTEGEVFGSVRPRLSDEAAYYASTGYASTIQYPIFRNASSRMKHIANSFMNDSYRYTNLVWPLATTDGKENTAILYVDDYGSLTKLKYMDCNSNFLICFRIGGEWNDN